MTTATRIFFLLLLASAAFGCTASSTLPGVLAINLRTGETRTFTDEESVPDGWAPCDADMTCPAPLVCADLDESACIVRTDCDPVYAEGPPDSTDPFVGCSDLACAPDECGPAPGAPSYICDDGSVGGSTGRCLRNETGACGWEFRDCPPTDCRLEECGPALGAPSIVCDDGSIGGNTGRCLRDEAGLCAWELRECPTTEACTPEECGPAPGAPSYMCADGSWGGPGPCERNADGVCGYTWRECPPSECSIEDCGPAPGAHPRCSDGSESTTVCVNVDGVCGWRFECASCSPEDCGPAPGALPMCPDGTGADTVCEPSATGVCGWQFICPGS
jgi:hypothetical protein